MAEQKAVFTTEDGSEFGTREEADRHETLVKAKEGYDHARQTWIRAVTATHKTADGEAFEYGYRDYYLVHDVWGQIPYVERVTLYWVECDIDDDDTVIVKQTKYFNGDYRTTRFCITELYAHEKNAKKALVPILERHLADAQKRLAEAKVAAK